MEKELLEALRPFAEAARQMTGMRLGREINGQPLLGIGKIATVGQFLTALEVLEKIEPPEDSER